MGGKRGKKSLSLPACCEIYIKKFSCPFSSFVSKLVCLSEGRVGAKGKEAEVNQFNPLVLVRPLPVCIFLARACLKEKAHVNINSRDRFMVLLLWTVDPQTDVAPSGSPQVPLPHVVQ